jgi:hypothetical protein
VRWADIFHLILILAVAVSAINAPKQMTVIDPGSWDISSTNINQNIYDTIVYE